MRKILLVLLAFCGPAFAQEDKADREKALEWKAQSAVAGALGAGKARVMVRVTPGPGGSVQDGRLTVFVAANDLLSDADLEKARETVSAAVEFSAGRGDELLVMKPGLGGAQEAKSSGGLGDYLIHGLLLLAGIVFGAMIAHARRTVQDEKNITSRRMAPGMAAGMAPREKYVPPPVQPQDKPGGNDELNIPSRSGFYKR